MDTITIIVPSWAIVLFAIWCFLFVVQISLELWSKRLKRKLKDYYAEVGESFVLQVEVVTKMRKDDENYAWNLDKKDFISLIRKTKGY